MGRHEIRVPDLGIVGPVTVSLWLAESGSRVVQGDPVVEILAGSAVVDLSAEADGRLAATLAEEDEPVEVGQLLAVIESDEQEPRP